MRKVSDTMAALRRKNYSLKQENADLKAKMAQLMQDIESAYLHTEAYAKTQAELEKARSSIADAKKAAAHWRDKYEELRTAKEQKNSTAEPIEKMNRCGRRRRVSASEKEFICILRQCSFSYAMIANITGYSRATACRICNSFPADFVEPK